MWKPLLSFLNFYILKWVKKPSESELFDINKIKRCAAVSYKIWHKIKFSR